jgi:tight adherence protein C
MLLILLIGLTLLGAATVLVVRVAALARVDTQRVLDRIRAYGFGNEPAGAAPAPLRVSRQLDALASVLGEALAKRFESLREDELRVQLRSAGIYTLSPRKFLGYRLLATVILPIVWLWYASSTGAGGLRAFVGLVIAGGFAWLGPMVFVRRRARMRLERIDDSMPGLIDLLVTMVEAGVGFSGSLQLAANRMNGPLAEELRLAVHEQNMGLDVEDALANMATRADTPSMRSFVRSIIQGETLGVSIGKIMRDLAVEMRKRRRQVAEERAQKAPTKMLFPLVLLIFPAMFVVILGPAAIQIMRSLSGTG